jgi:hypothetical protein
MLKAASSTALIVLAALLIVYAYCLWKVPDIESFQLISSVEGR